MLAFGRGRCHTHQEAPVAFLPKTHSRSYTCVHCARYFPVLPIPSILVVVSIPISRLVTRLCFCQMLVHSYLSREAFDKPNTNPNTSWRLEVKVMYHVERAVSWLDRHGIAMQAIQGDFGWVLAH
jgi:hypothetical protein